MEKFILSPGAVTLRVIALVIMFAARIRYPVKHSSVNVLRKRYSENLAKNVKTCKNLNLNIEKGCLI